MRLHILSDLHLEHSVFDMPAVDSDVLILAGDILTPGHRALAWAARESVRRGREVIQVAGNHEYYGRTLQAERMAMRETAERLGIHYLDRDCVVIDGTRFLGCTLWTDYEVSIQDAVGQGMHADPARGMAACARSLADHSAIRWQDAGPANPARLVAPQDLLGEHQLDRQWLAAQLAIPFDGPTVVMTHHAPHANSIAPKFALNWVTCGFASHLPASFFAVPGLWIHGHTHSRFDYRVLGCRVMCNPRGYRMRSGAYEVDGFDPQLVVEV